MIRALRDGWGGSGPGSYRRRGAPLASVPALQVGRETSGRAIVLDL